LKPFGKIESLMLPNFPQRHTLYFTDHRAECFPA
jgi:hypothetical protein